MTHPLSEAGTSVEVTDDRLREIIDGCEGVAPAPWTLDEERSLQVYDATNWPLGADADTARITSRHIQRLDPVSVASMARELLALRAAPSQAGELVERLRHAATTAANDDLSEPMTDKRLRHVQRMAAMTDAADALTSLQARVEELERERDALLPEEGSTPDAEFAEMALRVTELSTRLQEAEKALAWSDDIYAAPAACHVLAAYWHPDGEWVEDVVMSPPESPYTHWRMLDTPEDRKSP